MFPRTLPDTVFIDVRSRRAAHILLGHELTHHMENDAPSVYAKLQHAVNGLLLHHEEYARINGLRQGEYASNEMIGDLMGDNFDKPEFWKLVAKESGGAFRQIANTVKAWLDRLVGMIKGKLGFRSERFVSDINAARRALAQALAEYAGNRGAQIAGEMRSVSNVPQFGRNIGGMEELKRHKDWVEGVRLESRLFSDEKKIRLAPSDSERSETERDRERYNELRQEFLLIPSRVDNWAERPETLIQDVSEPPRFDTSSQWSSYTPIKFRITDRVEHDEEFSARNLSEFSAGLSDAYTRFLGWTVSKIPEYQTIKREQARNSQPMLHLHIWMSKEKPPGWFSVRSYPQALGMGFSGGGKELSVSGKNIFRATSEMWGHVRQTIEQGKKMGGFIDDIVDPTPPEKPTPSSAPPSEGRGASGAKFTVIKGDKEPRFSRPEQIKSAIGNRGTFDATNPDIRFSREPLQSARTMFDGAKQAGYKATARKIVERIDQSLNPLGTLPEQREYLVQRYLAQGTIERANDQAIAIREAFTHATEEQRKAIYDYLVSAGATTEAITDNTLRIKAEQIKAQIGKVGDELVEKGLLSQESRDEYRDAYLPRLYLKHLLSEQDWRALGAGKKPSDMGYLKTRKDIPEDVRKVILGEITEPGFLASVAIAKPARDMALIDWLDKISANANWIMPGTLVEFKSTITNRTTNATPFYLQEEAKRISKLARYYQPEEAAKAEAEAKAMDEVADDAIEGITGEHSDYKQIPASARYGRLRGMFVRTEIYNDLMGINDFLPSDPGWFQNVFGYGGIGTKATQVWKGMKVAMNPPAQVRNFVSNAVLLQLSGVPLHRVPSMVLRAIGDIRANGKYFKIAEKYGVGSSTFATQEVFRMKSELLDLEMKTKGLGALGKLHRIAALIMNKSSDFYQMSETIFKTAKIIDMMEREKASEQDAVIAAQEALFDYSLIQKSARYARSAPIGIPFLTFQIKVLPRLIETALLHPQRFLPWVALFYGFPMMVASMLGVDKDDLDRLKLALPEWLHDKGHALIMPYKDDAGRWQVIDLGYFMPWANWTQLAGNLASGEMGKAVQTAGVFSGPVTDIIVAIRTGKDPFTGREIWNKGDPPERQLISIMNYVWNMAVPPFMTDHGLASPMGLLDKQYGGKAVQAAEGTTNKYGEPRSTSLQAALYLAGINLNAITPEITRANNVKVMKREMQDAHTAMMNKLKDRSLTKDEQQEIVKEYATEITRRAAKLQKYAKESAIAPRLQ
ncbi:hypothetical protein CCP3SC15_2070004 [Gammaproteobacteria bacterium]